MSSTYNRFKSTTIFGNFQNSDYPDSSVQANAIFDRDLTVKNDIYFGNETSVTDPVTSVVTYTRTGANIKFFYDGVQYTITLDQLKQLLQNLASQSYVDTAIANLVGSSASTLDTLQELATALGNDPNFATTMTNLIGTKANINNPTFTGTITTPDIVTSTLSLNGNLTTNAIALTPTEISRLSGVSSNIQTQLDAKGGLTASNTWTGDNFYSKPIVMNNTQANFILSNTNAWTALTGLQNVIIGTQAGVSLTSGNQNIFIGPNCGQTATTATRNIAIGELSANALTTGSGNTYLGIWAGQYGTTAASNTYLGFAAGRQGTTGGANTCIGGNAARMLETGSNNVIIGNEASRLNTVQANSIVIGVECNNSATAGNTNIYMGFRTAQRALGGSNTIVGTTAFNGDNVNMANNTGFNNSGFGRSVLNTCSSGYYNCAFGNLSLQYLTTGVNNSAFGNSTGRNLTTSSGNTFLGAGSDIDISGNTWVGSTALGLNAKITASNQIVLGGLNSTALPTVFVPSGKLTLGGTYRTGFYNIDLEGNINTTTGYFDNGTNINTIYQPISSMSNYYTKSEIDTNLLNYYTKSQIDTSLLNYYLKSEIDTTFSNYYTKSEINTSLANYSTFSGNNSWTGTNTFNSHLPTSTLTPTLSSELITKAYADATYTTSGNILGSNNTWTGINTFNNNFIANSTNITPTELSYLAGASSNIQTQLTNVNSSLSNYQLISGMSSYQLIADMANYMPLSGTVNSTTVANCTGRFIFAGRGISGITSNVDDYNGLHIQWNRINQNGQTFFMNRISTGSNNNGGFRFQRYNATSVYIDEPLTILDTVTINKDTTINGSLTIPTTKTLALVGNLTANAATITPVELSYIDGVSSNIQTQLNAKSPLASPTFTGTITAPIINASGLITANGGLTIPATKLLNIDGDIIVNTTTITPTVLSYISTLSSNAQTQINAKAPTVSPTFTGTITAPIINASGLITANGGLTIPSTKVLTLTGNISANSATISPVEISYLDNVSSNIQTQLDSKAGLATQNTWTNWNNFNYTSVYGCSNAPSYSRTANIPNQQGLHFQWNRDGSDGYSYIMNHKGGSATNAGFRFQRYTSAGVYIDEPFVIGDVIYANSPIQCSNAISTVDTVTATNGFTNTGIRQYSLSSSDITASFPSNQYVMGIVPSHISAVRPYVVKVGDITVPKGVSVDITISTPFTYFGETGELNGFTESRNFTNGLILIGVDNSSLLTTVTPTYTDSVATNTRNYIYPTTTEITQKLYKQYISNVVGTFTTNYDPYNSHTYEVYISTTNSMAGVEFNTTYSSLQLVNCTTSSNTGAFYSAGNYSRVNKLLTPITEGVTEVNDLRCSTINSITPYLNKCAFATIKYNGSSYFIAGSSGNIAITFSSPNLLIRLTNTTTSGLSYSPQNTYFNVSVSGTQNNDGVLGNSLNFQVFSKGTYSASGQNYYGFLVTWCKIGTTSFVNLGTNTGTIDVMMTW